MSYDTHQHNWRLIETKTAFEPYNEILSADLYLKVEYGVMACGCGEIMKRRIISKD